MSAPAASTPAASTPAVSALFGRDGGPAVVPMTAEHLDACADIAATAPDPWSRRSLENAMAEPLRLCLVAVEGNRAVGFACFLAVGECADLELAAVLPAMRRRGVARALIERGFAQLALRGAARCLLEVRESNAAALALYAGMGFRVIARRAGLYQNPPESGVMMEMNFAVKDTG